MCYRHVCNSPPHCCLVCHSRYDWFIEGEKSLRECQAVLRKAKKDMLSVYGRMLEGDHVASEEKTIFRYYCEAILILGHFLRPGAVEGLTVSGLDLSFCGGISLNRLY